MASIAPSGNLTSLSVPRLLLRLRRERFSGSLLLARERLETRVLLRAGLPVHADSTTAGRGLCAELEAEGRLVPGAGERVAAHAAEHGVSEAAALLQLKLLPPREVLTALREQLRRRILDAFAWPDGRYQLEPAAAPPSDTEALGVDPVELVREGLARHWPPERLLAGLLGQLDRHPVATRGLRALRERLANDDAGASLLDAFDGSASLGALLEQARTPGALTAAWLADAAGLVEWHDAPVRSEKPEESGGELEIAFEDDAGAAADPARPRAAPSGPAAASDVEAVRAELLDRHARLAELDHYALLGVARNADTAAIRRAYTAAAKRFHPDALASQGMAELRETATAVFARVARAYAALSDADARRDYDADLDGHAGGDADRIASAEGLYRKAEVMLRMGDFAGALGFLRSAVQLVPDDPAYRSALGWALHKKNPPESQSAREHLQKALAIAPNDAKAHFRLGVVLRALGDAATGERHLARARQLDPKEDGR
jgi:Flp pilus assembly protein TadD